MRLLSATIRNYRMHKELNVTFGPELTLIGGANESGKSTLIEAIHRALFLISKGGTSMHKAMKSDFHSGNPEVILEFEQNGTVYKIHKRFLVSPSTSLSATNMLTLHDDEAEKKLSQILGTSTGLNRGEAKAQWSHLWVWQGISGNDPSSEASNHHHDLMKRLQNEGAAALIPTDLDAGIFENIETDYLKTHTSGGKVKSGSELDKIQKEYDVSESDFNIAEGKLHLLESAADEYEQATKKLVEIDEALEIILKELIIIEERKSKLDDWYIKLSGIEGKVLMSSNKFSSLRDIFQQITEAEREIALDSPKLKPLLAALNQSKEKADTSKSLLQEIEQKLRSLDIVTRSARLKHELSRCFVAIKAKSEELRKLSAKHEKILLLENEIEALEKEKAIVPEITKSILSKINKADRELRDAEISLRSMSTELEILRSKKPFRINNKDINSGEKIILSEVTNLFFGADIELRIAPGGGDALADARKTHHLLSNTLRELLDKHTLSAVPEAEVCFDKRQKITDLIENKKAELKGIDADSIKEEINAVNREIDSGESNMKRLKELDSNLIEIATPADTNLFEQECENDFKRLDDEYRQQLKFRDKISGEATSDEATYILAKEETLSLQMVIDKNQDKIALLMKQYGNRDNLISQMNQAEAEYTRDKGDLTTIKQEVQLLRPDSINDDINRLKASHKEKLHLKEQFKEMRTTARTQLHSEGLEDPRESYAKAKSRKEFLFEQMLAVKLRVDATKLLYDQFRLEKNRLSELFTIPLAEKVKEYLECIFDPGVEITFEADDSKITEFKLCRPGFGNKPFLFESLSGGAREQLASAFRLAMAEVLAEDHGGCLPVVFDDAFTNSDPDRIKNVHRMLYLASRRGLQIIVMTCNPNDYIGLGAREIILNSRPVTASAAIATKNHAFSPQTVEQRDEIHEPDSAEIELFISQLKMQGGRSGNVSLQTALGWDDMQYQRIKDYLIDSGKIIPGKGKGGSVNLAEDYEN